MDTELRPADLVGAWRLHSWTIHYPDGRQPGAPFGQDPAGLLLYSADGWMSAVVHRAVRNPFPAETSPRQLDNERVAAAYWSYFHYAGSWRIEGDTVIHTVRHSLNPALVGTEQVRRVTLDPPHLILTGIEPIAAVRRRHELAWSRAPLN